MPAQSNIELLSAKELARYSRQIILPELGKDGQERLKTARVLVIGAGGLGSPALFYLGAAGVGTLGIADFDIVEENNLHRQILHSAETLGRRKTESAAGRLRALNSHVKLDLHEGGVTPENATELFAQYDIIVDGSDNFATRYLTNDAAFLTGKPLVYGSIHRFEGQVSFFDPQAGSPCYRCLFPHPPAPGTVPNCAEAGVIGAIPGVIGSLQAIETVKWITGAGELLTGRLVVVDTLSMRFRTLKIKKDPGCPLCGEHPSITEIVPSAYDITCEADTDTGTMNHNIEVKPEEVHEQMKSGRPPLLIDVREPFEVEICRIPGARTVPMREVPARLEEIPRDQPVVIYCHHGMRSMQVVEFLRKKGYDNPKNLEGGIHAWAKKIDPEMPRY